MPILAFAYLALIGARQGFADIPGIPIDAANAPGWVDTGVGFSAPVPGMLQLQPSGGDREWALRHTLPLRSVQIDADFTPTQANNSDWKTGGIGVYLDAKHFWGLNLVEGPEAGGKQHFVELAEMLDGNWNAQLNLRQEEAVGPYAWQFGKTVSLRLILNPESITGQVFEGRQLVWQSAMLLDSKAVQAGWGGLTGTGLGGSFTGVRIGVFGTMRERPAAKTPFPPFHWGDGPGQATSGYFQTKQDGSTWWIVDPLGKETLAVATDHVNYDAHWCEKLGYAPYHRNLVAKFGSPGAFAADADKRLLSWNFNTLGAGCPDVDHYQGLAHTQFLAFGADFSGTAAIVPKTTWTGWPDVYDPRWEKFCLIRARQVCGPEVGDPWLLGYFLDNELEWWGKGGKPWGIAEEAWKHSEDTSCKKALVASLVATYHGSIKDLNDDFGATYASFDEVLRSTQYSDPKTARGDDALMAFVKESAQRYFAVTTKAVRTVDADHMILGCRFAGDAPDEAIRAAGAACDIVTVNIYPRIRLATQAVIDLTEELNRCHELSHKPVMVTEWSFPALDATDSTGMHIPSTHGAGMRVDTQARRAQCFDIMQRTLFAHPFVVGSSYFMWADEPALGVSTTFPEDSNYGLVNEKDEPYALITRAATTVNREVDQIHEHPLKPATVAVAPVIPHSGPADHHQGVDGFQIVSNLYRLVHRADSGRLFDHVEWRPSASADWRDLGSYEPLIWEEVEGLNHWISLTRVVSAVLEDRPESTELVVELEKPGDVRCRVRVLVGKREPYFTAQVLQISNIGKSSFALKGFYNYALPIPQDHVEVESMGGGVQDYFQQGAFWNDRDSGLVFGAISGQDARTSTSFWIDSDGYRHADCLRPIGVTLQPEEKWLAESDEPWVQLAGGTWPLPDFPYEP